MRASLLVRLALAAAAAAVAIAVLSGGEDPYRVELRMANAGGLKDGSPVTIGGVKVGKVDVDVSADARQAVAELRIERRYAPIGRDARAAIVAQNLLGQKQVQLTPGDTRDAAPSGSAIPSDRITEATDLDRVLSVLDADTRARLAIFVNEAGTAFTGRRADFNRMLRELGPAIDDADALVAELAEDNRELGRLVGTADRYVASVTVRRGDVVRAIDRFGAAAETGATKRAELRRTLAEAPGALRAARGFLAELERTTVPLGPAARQLSRAAAPLRETVDALEPFRRSAVPALEKATAIAPTLQRLATRATPVLRQAAPATAAVRGLGEHDLPPVLDVTDRSLANTLAVVDNWAGAIQYRDGLSHIFRGEASFSPDALQSIVTRLSPRPRERARRKARAPQRPAAAPAQRPAAPRLPKLPAVPDVTKTLRETIGEIGKAVDGAVKGLTDPLLGRDASPPPDQSTLLDFLLR